MKKLIIAALIILCTFLGCNKEDSGRHIDQFGESPTTWVYVHLRRPEESGIKDSYYFGRVNSEVYQQVVNGERTGGFVLLSDVRYLDTEDIVQKYEDNFETGNISVRAKYIESIETEKGDPIDLYKPADVGEQQ